jgi:hypothetical protein
MASITAKENYLRLARGEMPEYVPSGMPYKERIPSAMVGPFELFMPEGMSFFGGSGGAPPPTEFVDRWGVPHVSNPETGYAALPKPGAFILDDIYHWESVVKHPKLPERIDWEGMVKKQLERVDRKETAVSAMFSMQAPFQQIMGFMGFENGLMALYEEPEKVKELLSYLCDWYEPLVINTLDYFKPDLLGIADDTATKSQPFFSVEIYRDLFKPFYARLSKHALDRGVFIEFHNCGRCEAFVPDMIDFGVKYWNPAQTDNDLLAIKAAHKGQIAICGGWDFVPDGPITEEQVRQSVRDSIDKYAPGGGYAFMGGYLGAANDGGLAMQVNGWVADEVYTYGTAFYR